MFVFVEKAEFSRLDGGKVASVIAFSAFDAGRTVKFDLEKRMLVEGSGDPRNRAAKLMVLVHVLKFAVLATCSGGFFFFLL